MALTAQELRCVDLTCDYLGKMRTGEWHLEEGAPLEDLYRNEPVPEVKVTNGSTSASVEVKRLAGDDVWQEYIEAKRSLARSLVPAVGGYYALMPWIDFRLPMGGKLKKTVKTEIERLARAWMRARLG